MKKGENPSPTKEHVGQNPENTGKSGEERSQQPPKCPECGSGKVWKDGLRYLKDGDTVQRWLCRECGYRFSEHSLESKPGSNPGSRGEDCDLSGAYLEPNRHAFNRKGGSSSRQVGAGKAKNLAKVETRQETAQREGTEQTAEVKGKIVEFLWYLKKQGYADSTVKVKGQILQRMIKHGVELRAPEDVKHFLARHGEWSNNYKDTFVNTYTNYLEMVGGSWNPPTYKPVDKLPFIPYEEEIDALIAGCGKKVATSLQLLKETGMRIGEAWKLKWSDVDVKRRVVSVTPEKHGKARHLKVSNELIGMLQAMPQRNQYVFADTSLNSHRSNFCRQRKRIADKLQNPRIRNITFHTLRHWKATMEYHRTKDILYVKQLLGHRNIKSTMKYTQLIGREEAEEWTSRVAHDVEEARELVEAGFEYVTGEYHDGGKIFRKQLNPLTNRRQEYAESS